jgi:hypothetical protein
MAIEVVPFDHIDGPLLGLYTGDHDPRPCLMPAFECQQQKYSPQARDERATGVVYVNLSAIRLGLSIHSETSLTPLDEWSMRPLVSMASKPREEQLRAFESALSELVLLVKTTPISCPAERGVRGFLTKSLNREVEGLLT